MAWQVAKAGFAPSVNLAAGRRLARGLAILFLLTHQAWAGVACYCQPGDGRTAHACCEAALCPDPAGGVERPGEAAHPPASSPEGRVGGWAGTLPHGAVACGHAAPPAEAQGITPPSQGSVPAVSAEQIVSLGAPTAPALTPHSCRQPHHTRPLYLALSCLLI